MIFRIVLAILISILGSSIAHATQCSPSEPESFNMFFQRFSSEKDFYLKRTIFPLQVLVWEYGLNEKGTDESSPIKSFVTKSKYDKSTLLKEHIKANNLRQRTNNLSRTVVTVDLLKDGTGEFVTYHFKQRSGCWHFWKIENRSI